MSAKDLILIGGPPRPRVEVAYRPERVFVTAGPVDPGFDELTIELGEPICLMHFDLIKQGYAHRGRRYVGRKIRQERRKRRRLFGSGT